MCKLIIFSIAIFIGVFYVHCINPSTKPVDPSELHQAELVISRPDQSILLDTMNSLLGLRSDKIPINNREISGYQEAPFVPHPNNSFNFGYTHNWHWIRLYIHNQTDESVSYRLILDKPTIQFIHFLWYERGQTTPIQEITTGIDFKFEERPNPDARNFVFDLTFYPKCRYVLLLCLRNPKDNLNTSIHLKTAATWTQDNQWNTLLVGILVGMTILGLFSFTFYYAFNRSAGFLTYPIYLLCIVLNILSHEGFTYQFLWSDYPVLATLSKCLFIQVGLTAWTWFLFFAYSNKAGPRFLEYYNIFAILLSIFLLGTGLFYLIAVLGDHDWLGRTSMMVYNMATVAGLLAHLFFFGFYMMQVPDDGFTQLLIGLSVLGLCLMGLVVLINNLTGFMHTSQAPYRIVTWSFFILEIAMSIILVQHKMRQVAREKEKKEQQLSLLNKRLLQLQAALVNARTQAITNQSIIHKLETNIQLLRKEKWVLENPIEARNELLLEALQVVLSQSLDMTQLSKSYLSNSINAYFKKQGHKLYEIQSLNKYLSGVIPILSFEQSHFLQHFPDMQGLKHTHYRNCSELITIYKIDKALQLMRSLQYECSAKMIYEHPSIAMSRNGFYTGFLAVVGVSFGVFARFSLDNQGQIKKSLKRK